MPLLLSGFTRAANTAKYTTAMELPKIVRCENAPEYLAQLDHFGRRGWIFRGHSLTRCGNCGSVPRAPLRSSLHRFLEKNHRHIPRSSWYIREGEMVRRFKNAAPLHLQHLPQDVLDWLALMRHYGAPTRLLDFTFNPAVALFFALDDWGPNVAEVSVHALHLDTIRRHTAALLELRRGLSSDVANPSTIQYQIGSAPHSIDFVGVFDGELPSARQQAQEALFLVPSRIDLDFESWLRGITPAEAPKPLGAHWIKFEFDADEDHLRNMVKQLMNMGMSSERLFPGLEGICESFRYSWLDVVKDLSPLEA